MQKAKASDLFADQESEEHALNQKHYDLTRLFDRPNQSKFQSSFYLNIQDYSGDWHLLKSPITGNRWQLRRMVLQEP